MAPRPLLFRSAPATLLLAVLACPSFASPIGAADGTWQGTGLLQVSAALAIYDPARDQLLSIGGSRGESWALPLAGRIEWQQLPTPNVRPTFLATQDPSTGLVYFLDWDQNSETPGLGTNVRVRTLDPRTGRVDIIPASGPTPPLLMSIAFDGPTHRVVGIGRLVGPLVPSVWVLDLLPQPSWSEWQPAGPQPVLQYYPRLVIDQARRQLLVLDSSSPAPFLWTLTLDGPPEWRQFDSNGLPDGRALNPLVPDPAGDRVLTIDAQGRLYALSLATYQWSPVPTSGPGPPARTYSAMTIDPARRQLFVSGGDLVYNDWLVHGDTWMLPLDGPPTWTQLVPDAERPTRAWASDGYDAARHRLVVFGGGTEQGGVAFNDTWVLDLGSVPKWSRLATEGGPPCCGLFRASAWDGAHDRLLVYDADQGMDLSLLSFAGTTPTWSTLASDGAGPGFRFRGNLLYDPPRDRFLYLFCSPFPGGGYSNEVWELRLSPAPAWRRLSPAGDPPAARAGAMCAYDGVRDRLLVFGGETLDGLRDDLWALNLGADDGAWQEVSVASGPSPRSQGQLHFDPVHDRLILIGGNARTATAYNLPEDTGDSWALSLGDAPHWDMLSPAGPRPSGRLHGHGNGVYDPRYDRVVLAGGGAVGSGEVWTLTFGDAPTLLEVASREVTPEHVRLVWTGAEPGFGFLAYRRLSGGDWRPLGAFSADGNGAVALEDGSVTPATVLEYRLGATVGGVEMFFGQTSVAVPTPALSLTASVVGGRVSFAVALPSGEPATLSLFDVAGRMVWSSAVGSLGPGTHAVATGDAALPSALYFARLTQGAATRFARVALIR
jgi:hypothetical protein